MPVTIPLQPDQTHYELQVVLDEVTYTLEFRWNSREEAWYMNIKTEDGEMIHAGIKVTIDLPLGRRCRDSRRPPGALMAVDTVNNSPVDPGLEDLGDRVQLIYYSQDELPLEAE